MKNLLLAFCCVFSLNQLVAQDSKSKSKTERPKLVVGIVADQMKWDYLYRFRDRYGEGGFNRLLSKGFSFENVLINYSPSKTAVGHSTIYTGSVPAIHGITGNSWVDVSTGRKVYCVGDPSVKPVGLKEVTVATPSDDDGGEISGQMSPANLLVTTVTDELRLATNFRSKVVGVSIKDRAAILPVGHTANAAFWLDGNSGQFITSTYYAKELPIWVTGFNAEKRLDKLVENGWNTLYPIQTYQQSTADNMPWEGRFLGEKLPVFPHDLKASFNADKGVIRNTPFGNELTLDFAKTILDGYQLGQSKETDFLTINLASTDAVGHMFGPNSIEVEDTYLRLDKELELFFNNLDKKVGKGNYLVFFTADHGAAHAADFLAEKNIPSGLLAEAKLKKDLNAHFNKTLSEKDLIISISNYRVFYNQEKIKKYNYDDVKRQTISFLEAQPGIQFVIDVEKIGDVAVPEPIKTMVINGFNRKRSGPIVIIPEPGWFSGKKIGTTHGAWNPYDTHIPLIFMGWKIKPGSSNAVHYMTDIAPTISALLKIQIPNGSIGKPLTEVIPK